MIGLKCHFHIGCGINPKQDLLEGYVNGPKHHFLVGYLIASVDPCHSPLSILMDKSKEVFYLLRGRKNLTLMQGLPYGNLETLLLFIPGGMKTFFTQVKSNQRNSNPCNIFLTSTT